MSYARARAAAASRIPMLSRRLPLLAVLLSLAGCPAPAPPPSGAPAQAAASSSPSPRPSAPPAPRPAGPARALEVIARYPGAPLVADSEAHAVAFSPDGKIIASGGGLDSGASALLWDAATGQRAGALPGERGRLETLAFSPDGRALAASDLSRTITVWDLAARRVSYRLEEHKASVYAMAYSPDGRLLASIDGDGVVLLWDMTSLALGGGEGAGAPRSAPAPVRPRALASDPRLGGAVAFSHDGRRVAVPSSRSALLLLPVARGEKTRELAIGADVHSILFSSDGKTLLTGESWPRGAEMVSVRDAATGALRGALSGHTRHVHGLALTADGALALSSSGDGTARGWDVATLAPRFVVRAAGDAPLWSLALSPDGRRAAAAGRNRALLLFDARSGAPLVDQRDHVEHVGQLAYSPDGALLASGDHAGRVLVRDTRTGEVRVRLPDQGWTLSTLAFSPDGRRLLTVAHGEARLWDPRTGAELVRFRAGRLGALTYSPDGRRLAQSDETRVVRLLDASTGAHLRDFGAPMPGDGARQNLITPSSVAFTPDSRRMAVARWDQDVHLWDVETGALIRTFPGRLHVAISPDGRILAAAAGTISKREQQLRLKLWDLATGAELRAIDPGADLTSGAPGPAPRGAPYAPNPEARFSPSGALLATLAEGEVDLWDVATGGLAARGKIPEHRPISFAFSPDGARLATGGADASVVVWGLGPTPPPRASPP